MSKKKNKNGFRKHKNNIKESKTMMAEDYKLEFLSLSNFHQKRKNIIQDEN